MEEASKEKRLFVDQLDKLTENTIFGWLASLLNAIVLVIILWGEVNKNRLLVWLSSIILIGLIRMYFQNAYKKLDRTQQTLNKWENIFLITLAVSGLIWGAASIGLFPSSSIIHQSFIAFILGGLVAGSVGVFSVRPRAFLIFSIPAIFPLIVRFFLFGDPIHISMGFMLLLFWIIMLMTAKSLNRDILNYFLLKYENIDLISELETEVEIRKTAETKLTSQNKEIEKIVAVRTFELQETNIKLTSEIKERKLAVLALLESEEKYRELVENINDIIYSSDINGIITYVSPVVKSIFGYKPEEVMGNNFIGFVYKEDLPLVAAQFKAILAGTSGEYEYRILSKSGEYRWVRSSSRAIYKDGSINGLSGVLMDVSERKRLEDERVKLENQLKQSQKMQAIGTLAGGIAHDFNNILSGIFGYCQLAEMHIDEPQKTKKAIAGIFKGAQRASELVRQILTFSRQSENKMQSVDVSVLLTEALKLLRASIPSSIEIKTDIFSKATIMADPTQIHQVIMNLCTNAYHAMGEKGGVLTVGLHEIDILEPESVPDLNIFTGKYVRLEVTDTGQGIDKKNLERVFDPYFTTKEVGKGTGLGLAMVDGIVKEHNGFLNLDSEVGKGTRFQIFWPVIE